MDIIASKSCSAADPLLFLLIIIFQYFSREVQTFLILSKTKNTGNYRENSTGVVFAYENPIEKLQVSCRWRLILYHRVFKTYYIDFSMKFKRVTAMRYQTDKR